MARLDELARGIAQMLHTLPTPEPLPVDMVNETPAAAAVFVRAVVDACARQAAPLADVGIGPALGHALLYEHGDGYEGTGIFANNRLADRIEFYRFQRI
jgi:hypothetical protein